LAIFSGQLKGGSEIFDRSDFHDFYPIKPFWVNDFGAKYKIVILMFGGASIIYFLMFMSSVRISS
jgi:hypothetical protein